MKILGERAELSGQNVTSPRQKCSLWADIRVYGTKNLIPRSGRLSKEIVIGGTYLHYKNKKYKVTGVARHSETLEELVVYEALYENDLGKIWVRPKEMFLEHITTSDYTGPRFKLIAP